MSRFEQQANSTEGTNPTSESQKQNVGERTAADAINQNDPHKVEKLSKLGHADDEAAEGTK